MVSPILGDLGSYEPLVDDDRLEQIRTMVLIRFPVLPAETKFATAIQPAYTTEQGQWIPPVCIFLVITPNPSHPNTDMVSNATTRLSMWLDAEKDRQHLVGAPDPLKQIFNALGRKHAEAYKSLSELIYTQQHRESKGYMN